MSPPHPRRDSECGSVGTPVSSTSIAQSSLASRRNFKGKALQNKPLQVSTEFLTVLTQDRGNSSRIPSEHRTELCQRCNALPSHLPKTAGRILSKTSDSDERKNFVFHRQMAQAIWLKEKAQASLESLICMFA